MHGSASETEKRTQGRGGDTKKHSISDAVTFPRSLRARALDPAGPQSQHRYPWHRRAQNRAGHLQRLVGPHLRTEPPETTDVEEPDAGTGVTTEAALPFPDLPTLPNFDSQICALVLSRVSMSVRMGWTLGGHLAPDGFREEGHLSKQHKPATLLFDESRN